MKIVSSTVEGIEFVQSDWVPPNTYIIYAYNYVVMWKEGRISWLPTDEVREIYLDIEHKIIQGRLEAMGLHSTEND